MLRVKWSMGLKGSVLVANPVPHQHEVPFETMEKHIVAALTAADKSGITGKDITPFLLKYIADTTSGESLEANIELVMNNARLGAALALAYSTSDKS
jgi:pseudouridine-5'-phosphate glycosidase